MLLSSSATEAIMRKAFLSIMVLGIILAANQASAAMGQACATNAACDAGEKCVADLCLEECRKDSDCRIGMYCLRGGCLPDVVQCIEDVDCEFSDVCVKATCYTPDCETDDQCAAGELCYQQVCFEEGKLDGTTISGRDVDALKERLKEEYLGCQGSSGAGDSLWFVLPVLLLGVLRRRSE